MKQTLIYVTILITLLPLTSALTIDIQETYKPGQTALITIQGNFVKPLTAEQIYFYQGRIQIPLVYDLAKIKDKYYIYAILPNEEKNLTLFIKDAHYIENTQEFNQDINKNFSVQGNLVDFSISPGFIITTKDFEIRVQSKTKALDIEYNFLGNKQQVYVPEGQLKELTFSIQNIKEFTLTDIEISSPETTYKIPVAIIPNKTIEDEGNIIISKKFRFSPNSRDIAVLLSEERKLKINLINLGNEDLKSIVFNVSDNLKNILNITPKEIDLPKDDSEEIILTIKPDKIGLFSGEILAKSEEELASFKINVSVTQNLTYDNTQQIKTCAFLGGAICSRNEVCQATIQASLEGNCCVPADSCVEKKTNSIWKYILLLIIIVVLFSIAYFLVKKYRKSGESASDILKKRQEKFEKKLANKEVRGSLERA